MRAKLVSELIEALKSLDPNATWFGFDDGSLIIESDNKTIIIESGYYDD